MNKKIEQIRLFNRFYTPIIGLLDKHYLSSDFSLTETRIMFELYHKPQGLTATELIDMLQLDKGYLSRMLKMFEKRKIIEKRRSDEDKRAFYLHLSPQGAGMFLKLNAAAEALTVRMLQPLSDEDTDNLVGHMNAIRQILSKSTVQSI